MDSKPTINVDRPIESAKESLQTEAQKLGKAISDGVPPSNESMTGTLESVENFFQSKVEEGKLPRAVEKAAKDISTLLKDTKTFIEEKNADDSVQKIYTHGSAVVSSMADEVEKTSKELGNVPGKFAGKAKNVFYASSSLAKEMVYSTEFRALLMELIDVAESTFWRVEKKTESATEGRDVAGAMKSDVARSDTEMSSTKKEFQKLGKSLKRTLRTEDLTEDEKSRLRSRLGDILRRLKANPKWYTATQEMMNTFDWLKEDVVTTIQEKSLKKPRREWDLMTKEATKFLERFTGGKTIQSFSDNVLNFMDEITNDQELNNILSEWKELLNEAYEQPEKLADDKSFGDRIDALWTRSKNYMNKVSDHPYLDNILNEGREILESIRDDPLRMKLEEDTKILLNNFLNYDSAGKPSLNLELINQMKSLLVPLLSEQLKWIPLPRIVGSNETYDYWFDNMTFCLPELLPDQIHVRLHSEGDFDVQQLSADKFDTTIKFSVEGIKTTIKDIKFWFRRKAFPRTEDTGTATAEFTGKGASINLELTMSANSERPFKLKRSEIHFDHLSITVADTRHDILYNMIATIFGPAIKNSIEENMQSGFNELSEIVNKQLNRLAFKTYQSVSSVANTIATQQIAH